MTASGTRPWRRARRVRRPGGARGGGREVAARRTVARQPAAGGPRDRGGRDQLGGASGPRRRALAGRRSAGPGGHRRSGGGVDLGTHRRRVPPRCGPAGGGAHSVVAVGVNLSCPNTRRGATCSLIRPTTPGPPSPPPPAAGVPGGPAQPQRGPPRRDRRRRPRGRRRAVTLVNTVMGLAIDRSGGASAWGRGPRRWPVGSRHPPHRRAGGVRVHQALPDLPIVGVGGVANGAGAAELLLAGASARPGGGRHVRRPAGALPGAPPNCRMGGAPGCRPHGRCDRRC